MDDTSSRIEEGGFEDDMIILCVRCKHCWYMEQYANVAHKSENGEYFMDEEAFCTALPRFVIPVESRKVRRCSRFKENKDRPFSARWIVKKIVSASEMAIKMFGDEK